MKLKNGKKWLKERIQNMKQINIDLIFTNLKQSDLLVIDSIYNGKNNVKEAEKKRNNLFEKTVKF